MADKSSSSFDLILADLMLRVTVLEKLLIDKGIILQDDWLVLIEEVAKKAAESIIEHVNANKTVDNVMRDIELTDSEKTELKN